MHKNTFFEESLNLIPNLKMKTRSKVLEELQSRLNNKRKKKLNKSQPLIAEVHPQPQGSSSEPLLTSSHSENVNITLTKLFENDDFSDDTLNGESTLVNEHYEHVNNLNTSVENLNKDSESPQAVESPKLSTQIHQRKLQSNSQTGWTNTSPTNSSISVNKVLLQNTLDINVDTATMDSEPPHAVQGPKTLPQISTNDTNKSDNTQGEWGNTYVINTSKSSEKMTAHSVEYDKDQSQEISTTEDVNHCAEINTEMVWDDVLSGRSNQKPHLVNDNETSCETQINSKAKVLEELQSRLNNKRKKKLSKSQPVIAEVHPQPHVCSSEPLLTSSHSKNVNITLTKLFENDDLSADTLNGKSSLVTEHDEHINNNLNTSVENLNKDSESPQAVESPKLSTQIHQRKLQSNSQTGWTNTSPTNSSISVNKVLLQNTLDINVDTATVDSEPPHAVQDPKTLPQTISTNDSNKSNNTQGGWGNTYVINTSKSSERMTAHNVDCDKDQSQKISTTEDVNHCSEINTEMVWDDVLSGRSNQKPHLVTDNETSCQTKINSRAKVMEERSHQKPHLVTDNETSCQTKINSKQMQNVTEVKPTIPDISSRSDDDEKLIFFICFHSFELLDLKDETLWQKIGSRKEFQHNTWEYYREQFFNHLVKNIDSYYVPFYFSEYLKRKYGESCNDTLAPGEMSSIDKSNLKKQYVERRNLSHSSNIFPSPKKLCSRVYTTNVDSDVFSSDEDEISGKPVKEHDPPTRSKTNFKNEILNQHSNPQSNYKSAKNNIHHSESAFSSFVENRNKSPLYNYAKSPKKGVTNENLSSKHSDKKSKLNENSGLDKVQNVPSQHLKVTTNSSSVENKNKSPLYHYIKSLEKSLRNENPSPKHSDKKSKLNEHSESEENTFVQNFPSKQHLKVTTHSSSVENKNKSPLCHYIKSPEKGVRSENSSPKPSKKKSKSNENTESDENTFVQNFPSIKHLKVTTHSSSVENKNKSPLSTEVIKRKTDRKNYRESVDTSSDSDSCFYELELSQTQSKEKDKLNNSKPKRSYSNSSDTDTPPIFLKRNPSRNTSPQVKNKPMLDSKAHTDSDDDSVASLPRSCASRLSFKTTKPRMIYLHYEKANMLKYMEKNQSYLKTIKGNVFWKDMEASNAVPSRTWQSLKNHFFKSLVNELSLYNLNPKFEKRLKRYSTSSGNN